MDIEESELLSILKKSKNTLLIEPPYRRSYMPLGLAKISSFIKKYEGKTTYSRGVISGDFDLICITSMFTNDTKKVERIIKECKNSFFLNKLPILLGGIAASLVELNIFNKVKVFKGYSKILDQIIPDYDLDYQLKAPWNTFSYLFTQRGCCNKCEYCMVHKLEPELWINPKWKNMIISELPNVMISDNNILATNKKHSEEVLNYLGKIQKPILFNNGIYAKIINKTNAKLLAKIKYTRSGLRTAFDRIEDDGYYQRGMQNLIDAGCKIQGNSLTYILFNFEDTPQEAYYRAQEAWKFKSNPYLMAYRPFITDKKGTFIGKHWTKKLVSAFSYWGQTYGYNRGDKTFENWMKNIETNREEKNKLTDEDWDKWHYKG